MNVLDNYKEELLNLGDPQPIDDDDLHYCKFNYNHMPFMVKTNKICQFVLKKNRDNYVNISITSKDYLLWFETLYKSCIELVAERSEDWFDEPMTVSEVENAFINPLKSNIKGECFDIRCATDEDRLHIVDTKDNVYSLEELSNCNVIPTFHIKGLKVNSKYFGLDIEVNNLLVILEDLDDETHQTHENVPTPIPHKESKTEPKEMKNEKEEKKDLEKDELNEVSIPTDNLEEMSMDIESNGFYEIYELLDEKIKENVIQNLEKIFNKKKIKVNLELTDIFDEEE
uniref:Uncharacterized protein n=1 Tax=viral metagenome TaxID=1070528 RepID=A0A6C0D1F1_9ZZZZ